MIAGLLQQLYSLKAPKVRIKFTPAKKTVTTWGKMRFWENKEYSVSNVTALLLVIRLRSKDDTLFGWLVGYAPSE
jgi:hypothetical protein